MSGRLSISGMAGHLIRRLHQQSVAVVTARLKAAGLDVTPVQYAALEAVAAAPGLDQARLAEAIAYDRATIGGVVDRLQAKGLVARQVSKTDRRARVLHLTDAGRTTLDAVRPLVAEAQAEILKGLEAEERAEFVRLAAKALSE
ncbi:MarR family winged helix-turn-helix transcriptional regulator [Antarctobacter jejuensis]|uniref:MarR family winged helix-turn-helix transcriptional regulator n=1 Tax=Antarctobacter jejuensis TaxID=1439938 RepID=UPI003FD2E6B8